MTLSAEQIRHAILHPYFLTRQQAADYFSRSFSTDPEVTLSVKQEVQEVLLSQGSREHLHCTVSPRRDISTISIQPTPSSRCGERWESRILAGDGGNGHECG